MKRIILYIIVILISHIVTVSAIARCPFSYTVYVIDGDHTYGRYWKDLLHIPAIPMLNGYPAMLRVLDIKAIDDNPQNPNITFAKDNHWDFRCYWQSYATISCHYFYISENASSCSEDQYSQATRFRVIIGTEATPADPSGTPNLRESRSGRNCILIVKAGPNQNLELEGPANCTDNIQLDIKDKNNPLNLDMTTGTEEELLHLPVKDADSWFRDKNDADFIFYPEFSTPKK